MTQDTIQQVEELKHQANILAVGITSIIESNMRDSGQIHLAEMKLGDLLELFEKSLSIATTAREEIKVSINKFLEVNPDIKLKDYLERTHIFTNNKQSRYEERDTAGSDTSHARRRNESERNV